MYEGIVQDLIDELGRLPGVGPKSAQRIAFHILSADPTDVMRLADALREVKEKVRFCSVCGNVAEEEECRICRDPRRDQTILCVVEESKELKRLVNSRVAITYLVVRSAR
jgi:recombination protein RecR